jgi:type III secretion protein D
MTILRVLTGRHAGVQIPLSSSLYRISADDEADIQLTDWTQEPTDLQIMKDQVWALPYVDSSADPAPAVALEPFMPRRFGEVVLCIGPRGARWPSDRRLLDRLARSTQRATRKLAAHDEATRGGGRVAAFALALLGVLGVLVATGVLVGYTDQPAQAGAPQESTARRLERAIAALPPGAVAVRKEGGRFVVEGLLPTSGDVNALRLSLSDLPPGLVDHRYASVAQISQSIVEAMRLPGATVNYRGEGVFEIQASAVHPEVVKKDAARVAADLAPLVARIDVAVDALPAPERVPVGAALTTDGVQYVQTRDGVKYLELTSLPTPDPIEPSAR